MISTFKVAVMMTVLGASSAAFAAPPCEPGSKTGEQGTCSWTCEGGVYNISCVGGSGTGEQCYVHNSNNGSVCNANCDNYQCTSTINYNPLDLLTPAAEVIRESAGGEEATETVPTRDAAQPTRRR